MDFQHPISIKTFITFLIHLLGKYLPTRIDIFDIKVEFITKYKLHLIIYILYAVH